MPADLPDSTDAKALLAEVRAWLKELAWAKQTDRRLALVELPENVARIEALCALAEQGEARTAAEQPTIAYALLSTTNREPLYVTRSEEAAHKRSWTYVMRPTVVPLVERAARSAGGHDAEK